MQVPPVGMLTAPGVFPRNEGDVLRAEVAFLGTRCAEKHYCGAVATSPPAAGCWCRLADGPHGATGSLVGPRHLDGDDTRDLCSYLLPGNAASGLSLLTLPRGRANVAVFCLSGC